MIFFDLDPITAEHVAMAITEHIAWCRKNHRRYPADLSELVLHLTAAASRRQAPPTCPADVAAAPATVERHQEKNAVLLTTAEAAQVLNVSERTIQRRTSVGDLPTVKVGTATRIHRDDLDRYLDRQRTGDAS